MPWVTNTWLAPVMVRWLQERGLLAKGFATEYGDEEELPAAPEGNAPPDAPGTSDADNGAAASAGGAEADAPEGTPDLPG